MSFEIIRNFNCFPPIDILNDFFQCGRDDIESEETSNWKQFILPSDEYASFHDWCCDQYGEP
ncbi:MAG: hypothetical protein COA79_12620 [Planctomycetota bacterium]|nr:MAG: hypothetical protein COA79_12620 [Planctomycetota bacterium]